MALASGPGLIRRAPFARYVDSLDIATHFPGMRSIGIVWRVAAEAAAEAEFVARMRADGEPQFRIQEQSAHPGDRYITAFVEPRTAARAPLGFDLASEPNRRRVTETAMRTGRPSISAPVVAPGTSKASQQAFLLTLPIYRDGAPVNTEDERVAATVGWIGTLLLTEKALEGLGLNPDRLTMSLRDVGSDETTPFYSSTPDADASAAGGIHRRIELPVYGRTWQIDLRARPQFLTDLRLPDPRATGAFGSVLAAALALLMHTLAVGRRREHQARSEEARRAAIVDGSNDAIICQALDGTITDWNPGAERLFGHPANQVVGLGLAAVLLPTSGQAEGDALQAALLRGEKVLAQDTVRRHRDGSLLDVSLSAAPIVSADGQRIGVATTMRDISAARRAAVELREVNASLEARVAERTALLEAARRDLQAILDALPTAIAYWDRTMHNRFRNRVHRLWFGGDAEGQGSLRIADLFGSAYERLSPDIEAAMRGEARVCERRSPSPDSRIPPHTVIHYLPDVRDGEVHGFYVMGHDVTAAKHAEERLRASEEFLDRAGEIAGVGGWALDLRTMALTWSSHTYRIHEIDRDQPIDVARAIDFYPPEARPSIRRAVDQGIADGTPWDLELPFVTAKGRRLWVRAQGMADMENGRPVRLIGAFQDITERKRAAVRLEQALDRFEIAADSAHIGVWEYDVATDGSVWDERMYRLYGLSASDSTPPRHLGLAGIHPGDVGRVKAMRAAALCGEGDYQLEHRVVWPSGEVRHLRASGRVVRDPTGAPVRVTGVYIDISEQKRAELDLIETSSLLHTVLDSASEVSIIAGDPSMQITVFNRGAERLLGYDAAEVVGKTGAALQIHDREEVAARAEALSAELGRPVRGAAVFTDPAVLGQPREWSYRRKDGSKVQVSLIVTAMRAADGRLLGYLGIAHDVTRQKQHEESLRRAMNRARHASVAKSQFLANVSHEIRTPMNAVIGLTYLLGQSTLDDQQADMVGKLRIAGKALLGIINDVLDLSKIEADELTLERAPFTLRGVLSDLGALMSVQAGAKGIRFSIDAPAELPTVLDGDATRLGQILTNLVANAIKFTERGGIKLSVDLRSELAPADGTADDGSTPGDGAGPKIARLRFTVRDSGIGIPLDQQPRLFTPFVQADASTKRRFGGTGLGLSIVKRLVTLMGGTVWMESLVGVGSTFRVDIDLPVLDASTTAEETLATPQARSLQGVRILLTDDSDINLEVASRILIRHGAQITLAHDGQQAVDLLRQRPDGFDLVLMDVQMPVLDGHEATLRIRNELGLRTLPIIALTAGAFTVQHDNAGAAGMNDFIRKPFDAHGLVRTVLRHARPDTAQPAALVTTGFGADSGQAALDEADDAWPEISGIDRADVRVRLGGDLDLFARMLQRLLNDFSDLGQELAAAGDIDLESLADLGARMHKLKGSANTLGATAIGRLASRAEAACRAHQGERARQNLLELATQLETLSHRASAVLEQVRAGRAAAAVPTASPAAVGEAVQTRRLAELLRLLDGQSLGAVERFASVAPGLRQQLGERRFKHLQDHVDNLQFDEAATMLRRAVAAAAT